MPLVIALTFTLSLDPPLRRLSLLIEEKIEKEKNNIKKQGNKQNKYSTHYNIYDIL